MLDVRTVSVLVYFLLIFILNTSFWSLVYFLIIYFVPKIVQ